MSNQTTFAVPVNNQQASAAMTAIQRVGELAKLIDSLAASFGKKQSPPFWFLNRNNCLQSKR